jgi:tetratricopeptide (TPR) repeat protein
MYTELPLGMPQIATYAIAACRQRNTCFISLHGSFLRLATVVLFGIFFSCPPALSNHPEQSPSAATLESADSLLRLGKSNEAITALNAIALSDPSRPGVELRLGKAYYNLKNFPQAATHLKRAIAAQPQDWEANQLLALTSYAMGDCARAVPLMVAVLPHLPEGQADADYMLGICYLRLQDRANARKAIAAIFGVAPEAPMAYLMLAKMMVRQQQESDSVAEIDKALQLDPRLPMAHFLLGEVDLSKSDPAQALVEFQKEIGINPSVWLVYWRLGDTYLRLQKFDEAEKALKQALWLNDSFTGSYLMLGEVELQKNEPQLARQFLEHAVKLDPQNYYGHYFLGRAYQQLGLKDEAERQFDLQRALRQDSRTGEARRLGQPPP